MHPDLLAIPHPAAPIANRPRIQLNHVYALHSRSREILPTKAQNTRHLRPSAGAIRSGRSCAVDTLWLVQWSRQSAPLWMVVW